MLVYIYIQRRKLSVFKNVVTNAVIMGERNNHVCLQCKIRMYPVHVHYYAFSKERILVLLVCVGEIYF